MSATHTAAIYHHYQAYYHHHYQAYYHHNYQAYYLCDPHADNKYLICTGVSVLCQTCGHGLKWNHQKQACAPVRRCLPVPEVCLPTTRPPTTTTPYTTTRWTTPYTTTTRWTTPYTTTTRWIPKPHPTRPCVDC